ncbi:hypothetical protein PM082_017088 [Marasmius tenuissimus]|nr:hypothetical protein PM082_017088 [Marasmius tenuissimus]
MLSPDDTTQFHDAQTNNMDFNPDFQGSTSTSGLQSPLSPTSTSETSVRKRKRSDTGGTSLLDAQVVGGLIFDNMETEGNVQVGGSRYSRQHLKRDPTYYFEDGSCVLLVEDTLFNVHRTILSKDHSSFSTMFTLPQGGAEAEGRSDDNPIVLTGDKPSEFRNFHHPTSVPYTPPQQISLSSSTSPASPTNTPSNPLKHGPSTRFKNT